MTVVAIGSPQAINGKTLERMRSSFLGDDARPAAYLKMNSEPQRTLVRHLLGVGEKAFVAAANAFQLTTGLNPDEITTVVIDTASMPIGRSIADAELTELKSLFPGLRMVLLTAGRSERPRAIQVLR